MYFENQEYYKVEQIPEINYDQNLNYYNIMPYRTPFFKSIYEGISIEIYIVNHCNLNCAGCNRFAPLAKPWYITIEEFEQNLLDAKNNIPNIKYIVLMGGEPTLHPQLNQLSALTRQYFPEAEISIVSNGKNIKFIDIDFYKKLNIEFLFCHYIGHSDLETIKKFQEADIGYWTTTRLYSTSTLVNEEGNENNVNNFFNCSKYSLPNFVLKKSKLYICPFSSNIDIYCNKRNINIIQTKNIDYLEVTDIKNDLNIIQKFIYSPKNICKYCSYKSNMWLYHQSHRDVIEYNTLLSDLYFLDYKRYEQIIIGDKNYFEIANDISLNPAPLDDVYHNDKKNNDIIRFGKGKMDLIFIYNDSISIKDIYQLNQFLQKQSIIKDCCIYFISVCTTIDAEIKMIDYFKNQKQLNYIFLKLNKDETLISKIKKSSYNDYIYNITLEDLYNDSNYLERIYNIL